MKRYLKQTRKTGYRRRKRQDPRRVRAVAAAYLVSLARTGNEAIWTVPIDANVRRVQNRGPHAPSFSTAGRLVLTTRPILSRGSGLDPCPVSCPGPCELAPILFK